jgi:hypothetical protein
MLEHQLLNQTLGNAISEKDTEIERHQAHAHALQLELNGAQRLTTKLQADVRIAQEGALRVIEKERHTYMEDSVVRNRLEIMGDQFVSWARRHAIEDVALLKSVPAMKMEDIIRNLEDFCAQDSWQAMESTSPAIATQLPLLLVQASIAKNLLSHVFSNPFFYLPTESQSKACPTPRSMRGLYGALLKSKEIAVSC